MRYAKSQVRTGFWALAAVAAGPGCVGEEFSQVLTIVGNKAPSPACDIDGAETGIYKTRGTVDLVLTSQYAFHAIVKNNMPSSLAVQKRANTDARLEANVVHLNKAEITYKYPGDAPAFTAAPKGGSAFIAQTVNPGLSAAVTIPVVEAAVATAISEALGVRDGTNPTPEGTVVVTIQIVGTMLDGSPLKSHSFDFPIRFCKGCLLTFPAEAKLGEGNPNCRNEDQVPTERPCAIGQDDFVDCRICKERKTIAERNDCEPL